MTRRGGTQMLRLVLFFLSGDIMAISETTNN